MEPRSKDSWDVVKLSLWFGLVAGFGEGAGYYQFQKYGWLEWNTVARYGTGIQITWISPATDFLLFGAIGLVLQVAGRVFPSIRKLPLFASFFALLLFYVWISFSGRIHEWPARILALGLATVFFRRFKKDERAACAFFGRTLPWAMALFVLVFAGIQGSLWWEESRAEAALPAPPPSSPNILVVLVDTLRADHLSSYGYPRKTSPEMDKLASEGVLFENAHAASSWTLPSHVSLMTGRPLFEHQTELKPLDTRFRTIAEEFQSRGYRTGAFSANTFFVTRHRGLDRGFMHFEDFFHSVGDMVSRTFVGRKFWHALMYRRLGYEDIMSRKRAPEVNDATLRWIGRSEKRPFFAFLNYFDVHDPFLPPQPWRSKFSKMRSPGGAVNSFRDRFGENVSPEERQGEIDAYDGSIAYTDEMIGRLLQELRRRGLQNTIVVITSDHGEMLGEHNLYLHRVCLCREVIRVPLVILWPGHIPAGVRITTPVANTNLAATLIDLLGEKKSPFPGPSLAQLWQSPESAKDWPWPLAEMAQFRFERHKNIPAYHGAMAALVSSQWQYITNEGLGEELYDLVRDPEQNLNLAKTPQGAPVARKFATHLKMLRGQQGSPVPSTTERRLRSPAAHRAADGHAGAVERTASSKVRVGGRLPE